MDIHFYATPTTASHFFTPSDIYGRGVGGAELSLISLTEALASLGNEVTVWNVPPEEGVFNGVTYRDVENFDPFDPHEVFVLYRNPDPLLPSVRAKHTIFWSCDQQTSGQFDRDIFPFVDHTVTISPYHRAFHIANYHVDPNHISYIDLGVRTDEYLQPVEKIPNSLLYCSVPSRGLYHLASIFPQIRWFIPDATLTITSDFSLWAFNVPPNNEKYRELFADMEGVTFLGKVPRSELVKLQLQSDILSFTNQPDGPFAELFCVSAAEAQVAGCVPVTSKFGALPSTVMSEGVLLDGHPGELDYRMKFVESVVELLTNRKELVKRQNALRAKGMARFNWKGIAQQWVELINRLPCQTS